MPTLFLAHGNPTSIDDRQWMQQLREWSGNISKPAGILMISAHWLDRPITLGAVDKVPLIYDFSGFPERYYSVQYAAPGSKELSRRVHELLSPQFAVLNAEDRGLDHGAYIPLLGMYPDAEIPVLQMSIPSMDPQTLVDVGRALAPLRDEGYLIIGSGFLSHNLRLMDWSRNPVTPNWALEFDEWAETALKERNVSALLNYRKTAPGVDLALPTHEHFVPVLVTLGSSVETDEKGVFPITGFSGGSLTLRSVQYG